jgi:outer membrane protein TolC
MRSIPSRNFRGFRLLVLLPLVVLCLVPEQLRAQQTIDLTLERLVELGLRDSYRVRQLLMDIERTRSQLRAEEAGLKSRVELSFATPDFQRISDYKWNSVLQKEELVSENTRRWEASLSVRQPVVLFGFPTNGTLSLNNRMYRYTQISQDEDDIRYYNRYFVQYQQPLFQPNEMKNELERAELSVERSELEFQDNVIGVIDDLSDDYLELFETAYEGIIASEAVTNLEQASNGAREMLATNAARTMVIRPLAVPPDRSFSGFPPFSFSHP